MNFLDSSGRRGKTFLTGLEVGGLLEQRPSEAQWREWICAAAYEVRHIASTDARREADTVTVGIFKLLFENAPLCAEKCECNHRHIGLVVLSSGD